MRRRVPKFFTYLPRAAWCLPDPPRPPKGKTRNPLPKGTTRQRDGRWNAQGISIEKYFILVEDYFFYRSIGHAARAADVNFRTARRYIMQGNIYRGLEPIKNRVRRVLRGV